MNVFTRLSFIALIMGASSTTAVANSTAPMDGGRWSFSGDRFYCSLSLSTPDYGSISIEKNAGEIIQFKYSPLSPIKGDAKVRWEGAPWEAMSSSSFQKTQSANDSYLVKGDFVSSMMYALGQGKWLAIEGDNRTIKIPSIAWSDPSKEFYRCRHRISPLSIRQARDMTLYYDLGQRTVSESHLEKIDDLARYINLDEKVTRVLVDSYTDNTGNRLANLQLSRERSADVAAALNSAGVRASMIETRSHGERYPSADNSTARGRQLSRKVLIRIVRSTDKTDPVIQDPPDTTDLSQTKQSDEGQSSQSGPKKTQQPDNGESPDDDSAN